MQLIRLNRSRLIRSFLDLGAVHIVAARRIGVSCGSPTAPSGCAAHHILWYGSGPSAGGLEESATL